MGFPPLPEGDVDLATAAAHLGVTVDTLRRRIKQGQLRARSIRVAGRRTYIVSLDDLTAPPPVIEPVIAPTAVTEGAQSFEPTTVEPDPAVLALQDHVQDLRAEVMRLVVQLEASRAEVAARSAEVAARSADVGRLVEALAALTTTALPKPEPERRPWWRALIGG